MSPLPEAKPIVNSYSSELPYIYHIFMKDIATDEVMHWHVSCNFYELPQLFEIMEVNFTKPLEKYRTGNKKDGFRYHTIYPTCRSDVYLELVKPFTEKEIVVHRLGKKVNEQYQASLKPK